MKKFKMYLIFSFVALMFVFNNAYAQLWSGCPEGYQQRTTSFAYQVNGHDCYASVTYCVKCYPQYNAYDVITGPIQLDLDCVIPNGQIIITDFRSQMDKAITQDIAEMTDCYPVPCANGVSSIANLYNAQCYSWLHEENSPFVITYPCTSESYVICLDIWDFCVNPDGTITISGQSRSQQTGQNCTLGFPDLPQNIDGYWMTECFHNFSCD